MEVLVNFGEEPLAAKVDLGVCDAAGVDLMGVCAGVVLVLVDHFDFGEGGLIPEVEEEVRGELEALGMADGVEARGELEARGMRDPGELFRTVMLLVLGVNRGILDGLILESCGLLCTLGLGFRWGVDNLVGSSVALCYTRISERGHSKRSSATYGLVSSSEL